MTKAAVANRPRGRERAARSTDIDHLSANFESFDSLKVPVQMRLDAVLLPHALHRAMADAEPRHRTA
jgi:hypothetical protein